MTCQLRCLGVWPFGVLELENPKEVSNECYFQFDNVGNSDVVAMQRLGLVDLKVFLFQPGSCCQIHFKTQLFCRQLTCLGFFLMGLMLRLDLIIQFSLWHIIYTDL